MKITLNNFEKYNPRKDLKGMPWVRLQNNYFDTEEFYNESALTRNLFTTLLCLCAQRVTHTINYDIDYLCNKSAMKKSDFLSSIGKLEQKQVITIDTNVSDRIRSCSTGNVPNERTNEHNEQNERVFNIDLIYAAYPKKQGKQKGIEKLTEIIKTQALYDKVLLGAQRYAAMVERENTESKFIKQFSTWVNKQCWEDELDPTNNEIEKKIFDTINSWG